MAAIKHGHSSQDKNTPGLCSSLHFPPFFRTVKDSDRDEIKKRKKSVKMAHATTYYTRFLISTLLLQIVDKIANRGSISNGKVS